MGFDCFIDSNIPSGCGIPNHVVLIMAFYTFLEELTGQKTKNLCKKAYFCMLAQQDFLSSICGVGDPTVTIHAKADFALLLDCRLA